ncbi:hypothetical protein BRD02_00225 [Halobacteriales archaeon QS_8_69_73]|nr:MAG: hypothetical protein BRD02_00225 [Halobacteriales archaeon QS_8_69_73]
MREVLAVAIVVVPALVAGGTAVTAQAEFSVSVSGSTTDVPERTVSFGGSDNVVGEVAVRDPGSSVTIDAEGPDDETYDVNLYNSDGDVVENSRKRGGSTETTFDLDRGPGTYAATVYDDEVVALTSVVVVGYDVALDLPDGVDSGNATDGTVELTATDGGTVERVEVVLVDGDEVFRFDAASRSGSTYEATVDAADVPDGTYDAYGVVFSPDTFESGQNEIIGLGARQSFTVGDGGDSGGGPGGPVGTPTDDGAANDTSTPTPTQPPGGGASTPTDGGAPGDGDGSDPGATATTTGATDPGATTVTPPGDSDGTGPSVGDAAGVGAVVAGVVLVCTAVVLRRLRGTPPE